MPVTSWAYFSGTIVLSARFTVSLSPSPSPCLSLLSVTVSLSHPRIFIVCLWPPAVEFVGKARRIADADGQTPPPLSLSLSRLGRAVSGYNWA